MVNAYNVALFLHIVGAVTLFIAMGLVQRVGTQMRGAGNLDELRLCLRLVRTTGTMYPVALGLLLLTGLYMAGTAWSFETPWVVVGIVSLLVISGVGGGFVGRRFGGIGRDAGAAGSLSADLVRRVREPKLWAAATMLNGLAMGVLWLMAVKPGLIHSLVVVVALALMGAVAGTSASRRREPVSQT